jgi:hypothetical protein
MKSPVLVLLIAGLTGCSMFTKTGRQERAYEHYVRKSSIASARASMKIKFRMAQSQLRSISHQTNTDAPESPQSVTQTSIEPAPDQTAAEPQP